MPVGKKTGRHHRASSAQLRREQEEARLLPVSSGGNSHSPPPPSVRHNSRSHNQKSSQRQRQRERERLRQQQRQQRATRSKGSDARKNSRDRAYSEAEVEGFLSNLAGKSQELLDSTSRATMNFFSKMRKKPNQGAPSSLSPDVAEKTGAVETQTALPPSQRLFVGRYSSAVVPTSSLASDADGGERRIRAEHVWDYDLDEYRVTAGKQAAQAGRAAAGAKGSRRDRGGGGGVDDDDDDDDDSHQDGSLDEDGLYSAYGPRKRGGVVSKGARVPQSPRPVPLDQSNPNGAKPPQRFFPRSMSREQLDRGIDRNKGKGKDNRQNQGTQAPMPMGALAPPPVPTTGERKQASRRDRHSIAMTPNLGEVEDENKSMNVEDDAAAVLSALAAKSRPLSNDESDFGSADDDDMVEEFEFVDAPPRPPSNLTTWVQKHKTKDKNGKHQDKVEEEEKIERDHGVSRSTTPYFDIVHGNDDGSEDHDDDDDGDENEYKDTHSKHRNGVHALPVVRSNVQHLSAACPGLAAAAAQEQGANCWSQAPHTVFQVRGPNYLSDKKKETSGEPLYDMVGLDVLQIRGDSAQDGTHSAQRGGGRRRGRGQNQRHGEHVDANRIALLRPLADRGRDDNFLSRSMARAEDVPANTPGSKRFILAVNFIMPWGNFVAYLSPKVQPRGGRDWSPLTGDARLDPMIAKLASGDEDFCRARLKMVPHVVVGSWGIKKMVGNKPAIIGKVLRACHTETSSSSASRFLEIQLDTTGNRAARYLINAASNKGVVMDMGLVLQAESVTELPEQILGGLRVHRLSGLLEGGSTSESFNDAVAAEGQSVVTGGSAAHRRMRNRLGSRLGSASEDDDDDDDGDDDDELVRNTNNSRLTRQQPPTSLNTENRGGRRSAGSNSEEDDMSPGVVEQYRSAGYASSPTKKPSSWQRRLEREGSEDMESI